ncbi:hypothetical protein PFISCL1PPCAC_9726, partial [Pristionchus fissidentatus]
TSYIIICSLIRQTFLAYFSTLILIVAIDRWIATRVWSWYESQATSTVIFFFAQESFLISVASGCAVLLVYGEIRLPDAVWSRGNSIIIILHGYLFVYRRNLSEMRIIKKGAVIHTYSVARTFQLNENIALMKMLLRIAGPLVAATTPAFLFYSVFFLTPPNIGYDGIRYFSVGMYDLWLAVYAYFMLICVPIIDAVINTN